MVKKPLTSPVGGFALFDYLYITIIKEKTMKLLTKLLLLLILCSCGGTKPKADGRIRVFVLQDPLYTLMEGKVSITYNTKKLKPNRTSDEAEIVMAKAEFLNMKVGWYTVTFEGNENIEKCATNFKLKYESDIDVWIYNGQFKRLY